MNEADLDIYMKGHSAAEMPQHESAGEAVLNFTKEILHGGDEHKAWLIKAAINYVEGLDVFEDNEFRK